MTVVDESIIDGWRDMRAFSKEKRQSNQILSTHLLRTHGVEFVTRNNSNHLIVTHGNRVIDFWPSTGKWIDRKTQVQERGVHKLLRSLGVLS